MTTPKDDLEMRIADWQNVPERDRETDRDIETSALVLALIADREKMKAAYTEAVELLAMFKDHKNHWGYEENKMFEEAVVRFLKSQSTKPEKEEVKK